MSTCIYIYLCTRTSLYVHILIFDLIPAVWAHFSAIKICCHQNCQIVVQSKNQTILFSLFLSCSFFRVSVFSCLLLVSCLHSLFLSLSGSLLFPVCLSACLCLYLSVCVSLSVFLCLALSLKVLIFYLFYFYLSHLFYLSVRISSVYFWGDHHNIHLLWKF